LPVALAEGRPLPKMQLDRVYATRDEKPLKMDLFLPAEHTDAAPAVILVPGGPWSSGYRQGLQSWAADLSYQGYVTAAIDIRSSNAQEQFPADIVDVLTAITYIRQNAEEWNADPQRIELVGPCLGSHLGLSVGMAADASIFDPDWPAGEPAGVQAVVNRGEPIDFLIDPQGISSAQRSLIALLLGVEQIGSADPRQSPVNESQASGLTADFLFDRESQERHQRILQFLAERLAG
jgi:hypothetical protein